ncbi:hypothetical protein F7Q99_01295 [Streptomyces kaniharaensis]|uniref:Uncharacterized protein n=1 Tax=Streptomyces kaniharaensis TaxID=212423 RepID=A0A6N7KKJ9_9ACTN|nr:hypothetical protein [Streptomyces kaniharaensis]MQS10948.1 hypothetical protein [Streptomyces kaniharaensis]
MTPLGLSVASWLWIAVLAAGVFWAVAVPGMPTTEYRIRTALAPVVGALTAFAYYRVGHQEPATVIVFYTTALLAFAAGMIGHRRELARRLMEAKRKGEPEDATWSVAMMAQVLVSLVVFCIAAFWII